MRKKAFVGPKRQSEGWSEEVNSIEVCEISSDDCVFCVSVPRSDGSTHRHTESLSLSLSVPQPFTHNSLATEFKNDFLRG